VDTHLSIESDAPAEKLAHLVRNAKNGCFAEGPDHAIGSAQQHDRSERQAFRNRRHHPRLTWRTHAMPVKLNHTIVFSRDKNAAAAFLVEILVCLHPCLRAFHGRAGRQRGDARLHGRGRRRSLAASVVPHQRDRFDEIFGRIRARGLPYWADPGKEKPGETYTHNGGRGVYFDDPSGHLLEIQTRPYATGTP
jgi:hypothetical protein